MAMANILQLLGNAMERQQQRRHENNMEVLRAIYTRPGMIVLGVILLGAALALIWPQIAPEADNTNSIVIDMSDFDFGDEEMNRTVQKMVENDRKQKEQSGRTGAIFFGLGAAVCFVRAAMPWRKKEREKQFLTILRLKRQKRSPFRQSLWKTPRRQVRRPAAGKREKRTSRLSTRRES